MNSILQLVDSLRPDELIWSHAYMTGRVHALMPATHLQMSGLSMGTQSSVPKAAASVLDPHLWSHMQYMWATGLSSDDSP